MFLSETDPVDPEQRLQGLLGFSWGLQRGGALVMVGKVGTAPLNRQEVVFLPCSGNASIAPSQYFSRLYVEEYLNVLLSGLKRVWRGQLTGVCPFDWWLFPS